MFNKYILIQDTVFYFYIGGRMNKSAKIFTVSGIFFTLILGSLGHFFYEWSDNNYVVGLFFATNESVWEHIKLALFPIFISFLLYGLFARAHSNFFAAFFMAMLTVILFIPLSVLRLYRSSRKIYNIYRYSHIRNICHSGISCIVFAVDKA